MSDDYSPVRKLAATDQVDAFDCGQAALNQFLQRYALVNQKANSAQTYVCCQGDVVAGFYSLAVGSVERHERVVAAAPRMGVPIAVPRPGESVEPSNPPQVARWWPETRWTPAGEKLVMSSGLSEELAARVRRAHEVADVHAGGLDAVVPVAAAE